MTNIAIGVVNFRGSTSLKLTWGSMYPTPNQRFWCGSYSPQTPKKIKLTRVMLGFILISGLLYSEFFGNDIFFASRLHSAVAGVNAAAGFFQLQATE